VSKPVVTIIGHACIDHNTIDGTKYEKWGSSAMYIAKYYLKHFGIKSHIVSSYGKDFSKYANDFIFTENPNGDKTLLYENIVTNGHRVQYCRNSDCSSPVPLSEKIIDLLQKTDILIVAPQISNYSAAYISDVMSHLSGNSLKILLPQGFMRHISGDDKIEKREFAEAESILPYFDAVIASDEDYDNILDLAEKWAEHKAGSSIVITQAERGATVFHKGEVKQISTTPLPFDKIKNPVGSGDMFSAQFTIGLHNKLHPHDAVHEANKTTAQALLAESLS